MNELSAFLTTRQIFSVLLPYVLDYDVELILRRYEDGVVEVESAGFLVLGKEELNDVELICEKYNSNGYSEVYISFERAPLHSQHWGFVDANAGTIIEISGLRQFNGMLELAQFRLVAKKSKIKKEFKDLVSRLKRLCQPDLQYSLGEQIYPEVVGSKESTGMTLIDSFSKDVKREWSVSKM